MREIIVKHFKDIVQEDKQNLQKQNKSIALRLQDTSAQDRGFFKVNEKKEKIA